MAITSTQQTEILKIVSGLFNAAPGGTYLTELANLVQGGMTTSQLADALAAHSLFTGTIMAGKVTTSAQVNVLMNNFGLTADSDPASAGSQAQAYFTQQINAGVGFGKIVYDAVQFLSGSVPPEFTTAATLLSNKALVAATYSENSSSTSLTTLQNILSSVTGTAAYTNAQVQEIIAGSAPTGQTFTLTSSADTGTSFAGTSGNDTYNGQLVANGATGTTLTAGDNLNGGSGTDTLQISVTGDPGGAYTISAVTTTAIEKIMFSNFDSSAGNNVTYNAATGTGITTVGLTSSGDNGDTTFQNLTNVVSAEMGNGSADLTLTYNSTLLTGTEDTQNLTVSNITAGTFKVNNGSSGYAETLNIVSNTGKNTLTLDDNNHKTINITGDTNLTLTLTDTSNTVTKVNASAFTGALTLSGLGTTDISISGGSGNDTVTAANLDSNDTIAGGEGTADTLKTSAAISAANAKNISGFETLEVTGNGVSQAANALSGLTGLSVNDTTGGSANGTITFSSAAGTETLYIKSVGDATDDVALTLATDTSSNATTVTLGSSTAGVTFDDLTLNDAETITINNSVGSSTIATLISNDATKLVISASKALTITDALSASALGTIDASGSTANVTVTTASAKASSVTGGSGNDSVTGSSAADTIGGGAGNDTLAGGSGNDSIDAGAGNDSLTAGAGNDILIGGDGNDTFADAAGDNDTGSAGVTKADGGAGDDTFIVDDFSDLASTDTIIGGDGADTLKFTETAAHDFTADITILSNVSSVETFEFSTLSGGETVTINDAVVSAAGGALAAKFSGTSAGAVFNALGVTSSSSKVTFTDAGSATAATYSIGNGIDSASMGDGTDTVTITNNAYLSASDTLDGGSGADTLSFTYNTASTQTISAAQLTNVKGFETFSIDNGTDATLVNYVLTLDDTIVGNQAASGATFTITRGSGDDGTTKITASSVTSTYNLALTGGDGNDTIIGGAGADTIDGEDGTDSVTGGAGNDTFVLDLDSTMTITDMDFGTSSTAVDLLKIDLTGNTANGLAKQSVTGVSGTNYAVWILDNQTYADADAAVDAVDALSTGDTLNNTYLVIFQNSLGVVQAAYGIETAGNDTGDDTASAAATLTGLTITGVSSVATIADFTII